VSQRLRQKRSNLILSVAVFHSQNTIGFTSYSSTGSLSRGDVNLVVPMTYALDTYRFQRLSQPWITSTKLGSSLILPGIRLLDLPLSVALDQIAGKRPTCQRLPLAVEHLSDELQKIFHSTQGTKAHPQDPILHCQPFQPLLPVTLPYNENGIFFRKQSTVAAGARLSWRTQAQVLKALNQLSMLLLPVGWQWQKSLAVFQSQFPD